MNKLEETQPNEPSPRFHRDWTMLSVVVALLAFLAIMWTHLSSRIDTVQGASSERIDAVHSTLIEIAATLGRLDQRTQKIDEMDGKLDRLLQSVIELNSASHIHPPPDTPPPAR